LVDERTYQTLADEALRSIGDAFEEVDPEIVDFEFAGDVVTLTLRGGEKCVVNTQRPARQIWLAAESRAWHFSWDEARKRWMDDRGRGDELFGTIARVVQRATGLVLDFGET
jgi:CyaY protein